MPREEAKIRCYSIRCWLDMNLNETLRATDL